MVNARSRTQGCSERTEHAIHRSMQLPPTVFDLLNKSFAFLCNLIKKMIDC